MNSWETALGRTTLKTMREPADGYVRNGSKLVLGMAAGSGPVVSLYAASKASGAPQKLWTRPFCGPGVPVVRKTRPPPVPGS